MKSRYIINLKMKSFINNVFEMLIDIIMSTQKIMIKAFLI